MRITILTSQKPKPRLIVMSSLQRALEIGNSTNVKILRLNHHLQLLLQLITSVIKIFSILELLATMCALFVWNHHNQVKHIKLFHVCMSFILHVLPVGILPLVQSVEKKSNNDYIDLMTMLLTNSSSTSPRFQFYFLLALIRLVTEINLLTSFIIWSHELLVLLITYPLFLILTYTMNIQYPRDHNIIIQNQQWRNMSEELYLFAQSFIVHCAERHPAPQWVANSHAAWRVQHRVLPSI